ncbi:hypothetical protein [Sphingomonas sp. RB1R13]|uniref:hypothetical protein n=1 Tax=Sphingomonas sp. RB1R13 TaxID=3096159 RepID=UPI003B5572F2
MPLSDRSAQSNCVSVFQVKRIGSAMTDEELIAKLQARQPKRENYPTQDEFEESLGFWRSREGRMLANLIRPRKPVQGMSEEDKAELSNAITKGFRHQNEFADRVGALGDVRTEVPEVTLQTYKDAVYRVGTQPPLFLKVDLPSPDLARLYDNLGVKTAAFLTACNPLGHPLREEANEARQGRLRSDLENSRPALH